MLKALRAETELSDASFQRLAAAFPGLTEAEVAATAAGRKMIEQLTKFDQLGTAAEQFTEFRNKLIDEGNDVAGHLIQTLGGAVNQLEDAFAHLAVTGKANFKQIYQGIEESLVKTGLQKGVSTVLGGLRLPGGGGKPDGSSGHPLWVKMAGPPMPGLGVGPDAGAGGAPSLPPGVTGILQSVSKGLGSIGGFLGNIFGGFLAGGGDVTPGKAYVVGEKHPEFFVPKASGAVVPSLSAQTLRPLSYSATYNINTPNPDAFRRTQAQILAEGYRQMARSHARNS
jgi:phage-related minor tail protein